MPLELIADRPGHAVLRSYDEPPLQADQVRVRSLFSSFKHGSEFRGFRADSADSSDRWDGELRLHRRGEPAADSFPKNLGNMSVGEVIEVGDEVQNLSVGDRVFAHQVTRETHTSAAVGLRTVPAGVSSQALMYWDPTDFALGAVRDGPVRLGDRVGVFGLGAIGQMVAQAARLAGARWVAVSDPIAMRREAAGRHGADLVLDPTVTDAGLEVKAQTENRGVDIAFETSGSYAALDDALRATCYQGTVISTAYYQPTGGVSLAGEWHRNRIQIVSSRACSEPLPQWGWDFARICSESLALLVEGRLAADDLIAPIVSMAQAAEAYQEIVAHPERSIKLGIDHTLEP